MQVILEMSESTKLSKEQQDYCYSIVDIFHNVSTDLRNADLQMHKGKFFDAIDNIRVANQNAQLGEKKVKEFVTSLNDSGLW